MSEQPRRFAALDGIRGLSALCVTLFHIQILSSGLLGHLPRHFVLNSYLFVDFFFALSGFVIAASYADQLRGGAELRRFGLRRFVRLWPLHVAMLLALVLIEAARAPFFAHAAAGAVGAPFGPRERPDTILANLLLVHGLGIFPSTTWNVPSWSISVEFATYAMFALTCLLGGWRKPLAWAALAIGGMAVLMLRSKTYLDATYDFGFFRCLFGFFLGALTFLMFRRAHPLGAIGKAMPVAEFGAAIGIILYLCLVGRDPGTYAAPLIFALAIFVFAFEAGPLSALLRRRPVQWLGLRSYSIYMVQWNILIVFGLAIHVLQKLRVLPAFDLGADQAPALVGDGFVAIYVVTNCVVASITYRFIELPPQAWLKAATRGARPESPRSAARSAG